MRKVGSRTLRAFGRIDLLLPRHHRLLQRRVSHPSRLSYRLCQKMVQVVTMEVMKMTGTVYALVWALEEA